MVCFAPRPVLRFLRCRAATSAVEFAILSPFFLLFILGMIAYGIYFGASHSVQQLAADAARTALAGLSAKERASLAEDFISRNAATYAFVEADKLTLDIGDSSTDANQFTVAVHYDARNLPIWNLLPGLVMPGMTISQQSTIRVGGL